MCLNQEDHVFKPGRAYVKTTLSHFIQEKQEKWWQIMCLNQAW